MRRRGGRLGVSVRGPALEDSVADGGDDARRDGPGRVARRSWWPDAVGVAWTLAGAALVLLPALRPGVSLGPFDLLSRFGLTHTTGVSVHNAVQADQIQQFVPWLNLAWSEVHSGHLPLWNPYSILGMPLAFNWQSGVFSLPYLISYLFPVAYAYTVVVLAKIVIAGLGAYVLCRVLRLGALSAAFGASAFELSGPMVVHAGWPHTSVTCWAPWMLVAVIGLLRDEHRTTNVVVLAVAVAWAVYGGHPESLLVTGVAVVLFVVVYVVARSRVGGGPVLRPGMHLALGAAGGVALGAPLLLPGMQLGLVSARRYGTGTAAFPLTHLPNLIAAGLQGVDFRTAAYVGVVVLVLAAVGTRVAWRRPEVPALAVVAVVCMALTFVSGVDDVLRHVPGGQTVTWSRAVMLMALALALLAAFGLEALVHAAPGATAVLWSAGAFAISAVVVLGLAVCGFLKLAGTLHVHETSLAWPGAQAGAGLLVTGWWSRPRPARHAARRWPPRRWAPAVLVALETGFLLSAGIPFWSVGSGYLPTTPEVTALQRTVGYGLVGFGSCRSQRYLKYSIKTVGLWPNVNVAYGVRELTVYDPIIPEAWFREWRAVSGERTPPSLAQLGMFCAGVLTVPEARLFGVQYVLDPPGRYRPLGSVFVGRVGAETLSAVPGAAEATWTPAPAPGTSLPAEAPGYPLAVVHPDLASWKLSVDAATPVLIRLRLTDVPGWRASADGRPVALRPWAGGTMLELQVPPGPHVVELRYWPPAFSLGLHVAAVVGASFVVAVAVTAVRTRRRRSKRAAPGAEEAVDEPAPAMASSVQEVTPQPITAPGMAAPGGP